MRGVKTAAREKEAGRIKNNGTYGIGKWAERNRRESTLLLREDGERVKNVCREIKAASVTTNLRKRR